MKRILVVLAIAAGSMFGWFLHERIDGTDIALYFTGPPSEKAQTYDGPPISPAMRTLALRDLRLFVAQSELEYIAASGDQSEKVKEQTKQIEDQMSRFTSRERKTRRSYQGDRLLLMQLIHARITAFESGWAIHVGADPATRASAQQRAAACSQLARASAERGEFAGWRVDNNRVCLNVPDNANLDTVLAAALAYTGSQLAPGVADGTEKAAK